ncbi:hypothetical protein RSOLAG22IIIB_06278 [Rhizoctonia solani]|uniref:Uncharacterized protein n=1 Tax=Rhizoctonia solani TaxID=456999 RepID=A0A0K6GCY0_9AGAM|nr:hypothetical protein RSOLAG22IIIB_06278 [Rhizoctonia solani]
MATMNREMRSPSLYVELVLDGIDSDLNLKAAEMLAKYLHDGKRPGDRHKSQPSSGNNESPGRIPIHGVVVRFERKKRGMCKVNDELKSRFPPGIEYIICYTHFRGEQSCVSRFDMTGRILSREMCTSPDIGWDLWTHCTKHVMYWPEHWIPRWDKDDPVWTQEIDSSPTGAPDSLGLVSSKPVGMYRHELRKYHSRYEGKDIFMLLWKSYPGVDQSYH